MSNIRSNSPNKLTGVSSSRVAALPRRPPQKSTQLSIDFDKGLGKAHQSLTDDLPKPIGKSFYVPISAAMNHANLK